MPEHGGHGAHSFQVDLRGLVDLLSHHLYSSPRVYVRELLQNAVDAVTARLQLDPAAPTDITLHAGDGGIRIEDPGIGLTEADVHRFLATIGGSSKRDSIAGVESARREFLGQFGIGLLACFLVADEIVVVTRSAADPAAPPVEWRARDDGSYALRVLPPEARPEPGTTVTLTPRPGEERWFEPRRVAELARDVGSMLPHRVTVRTPDGDLPVTDPPPYWERDLGSPDARRAALLEYGERTLGFVPLDVIDLEVPVAGVRGLAFVLPRAVSPADTGRHRVYLKGMLLSDAVPGLLPDWAFFVRCVVSTDTLRPTASRESLYEDDTLQVVREALGDAVRDWIAGLAAGDPQRLEAFLRVHRLGVLALALTDPRVLEVMLPWLRFETTDGQVPLDEFARRHRTVFLTRTVEEFRQVAPIAAAQGLAVVNGGYTYEAEIVEQLPRVMPGTDVRALAADVVTAHLDTVPAATELALAPFLGAARERLAPLDCDVVLRAFHPVSVPALFLDARDARHERERAAAQAGADPLWNEILAGFEQPVAKARLVLNHHSPVVRRVAALPHPELMGAAAEALYGQALLMTHRPLRAADTAVLNRAFGALLDWTSRDITEDPA